MKATDLLKKQHRQVEKLFKQVEKTEDARQRRQLLQQIQNELKMHTKIEEEVFYPAVREMGTSKAEKMVDEAFEEHHVVDLVLAELPQVDPEDERFEAKMTVLSELVERRGAAVLSGPTFAEEIADGLPAAAVIASSDPGLALELQEAVNSMTFRVYVNEDLVGVELCAAAKNVMALAAGGVDGLGLGDNAKAALIVGVGADRRSNEVDTRGNDRFTAPFDSNASADATRLCKGAGAYEHQQQQ